MTIHVPTNTITKMGIIAKAGIRSRKTEFAMEIVSFVEAGDNTGYFGVMSRGKWIPWRGDSITSHSLRKVKCISEKQLVNVMNALWKTKIYAEESPECDDCPVGNREGE